MPVILQADADPGTASWVDQSTIAGAVSVLQKRIQLADIAVAATETTIDFDADVPAASLVFGAQIYLTTEMAGGGVATGTGTISTLVANGDPITANFLLSVNLLTSTAALGGFIAGQTPAANSIQNGLLSPYVVTPGTPFVTISADVNLDTLTQFDATFYVFYVPVVGMTLPA